MTDETEKPAAAPVKRRGKRAAPAPKAALEAKHVDDLNPDAPLLPEEEIAAIRAKALRMVLAERKKAAEKALLAEEMEKLRGKEGDRTGDPAADELVNIMIDAGASTDRIVINGRAFFHGQQYTVPRHKAESLREIMWRTQLHEHSITDKPLAAFYAKARNTVITRRGVVNAPRNPGELVL